MAAPMEVTWILSFVTVVCCLIQDPPGKKDLKMMTSCLRCLYTASSTCMVLDRFVLRQLRAKAASSFPTSRCFTHFLRHFAKDSTETQCNQSLNEKYLNYTFITTSKTRWLEFEKGCMFDVGIFDSFCNKTFHDRIPVIVGVPSCVGTHDDLFQYLYTFVMLGYRVIIPNIPGRLTLVL